MKKKYLVISAHPDDLDFACAGTVAKLTAIGNEVAYCILTNGIKGAQSVKEANERLVARRQQEQKAAAATVGVKEVNFLGQTDGELENTPALRKRVVEVIRRVKPQIILSFDPANQSFDSFYRFHRDHRLAAEIVFDSIYPAAGSEVFFPELIGKKLLPHTIEEAWFFAPKRADHYVNITRTIDKKIEALCQHKSQIVDVLALDKMIRSWARSVGKKKGMRYAESFRKLKLA